MTFPELTFLDMVRRLGELTLRACGLDCSPSVHRMEAARVIGILIANPALADDIADAAQQTAVNEYLAWKFGKEA